MQQQLDKITKEISALLSKAVTELPEHGTYLKAITRCGDVVVGIDRSICACLRTSTSASKVTHSGSHIDALQVVDIYMASCFTSTNGGSSACVAYSWKPEVVVMVGQVIGRVSLPECADSIHMLAPDTLIVGTRSDASSYFIKFRVIEGNISVMAFNKMTFERDRGYSCVSYEHSRVVKKISDGIQFGTIDLEWKDELTCKRVVQLRLVHTFDGPLRDSHILNKNTIVCLGEHALEVFILNDEATLVTQVRHVELGNKMIWDCVSSSPGYILVSGRSRLGDGKYIALVKTDLI
jgi:hypothetical protein